MKIVASSTGARPPAGWVTSFLSPTVSAATRGRSSAPSRRYTITTRSGRPMANGSTSSAVSGRSTRWTPWMCGGSGHPAERPERVTNENGTVSFLAPLDTRTLALRRTRAGRFRAVALVRGSRQKKRAAAAADGRRRAIHVCCGKPRRTAHRRDRRQPEFEPVARAAARQRRGRARGRTLRRAGRPGECSALRRIVGLLPREQRRERRPLALEGRSAAPDPQRRRRRDPGCAGGHSRRRQRRVRGVASGRTASHRYVVRRHLAAHDCPLDPDAGKRRLVARRQVDRHRRHR